MRNKNYPLPTLVEYTYFHSWLLSIVQSGRYPNLVQIGHAHQFAWHNILYPTVVECTNEMKCNEIVCASVARFLRLLLQH